MLTAKKSDFELIPEGEYEFKIIEEPEGRKKTSSKGKEYKYYIFKMIAVNEDGIEFSYSNIFVPWGELWFNFLKSIGGKEDEKGEVHLSETETIGKKFFGFIEHVENPKDPNETKAKITSVTLPEPEEQEDDDVPF